MRKFDKYFLMEEADILEYVGEKLDFFPEGAQLTCKEIGDGNLNYVFRVQDAASGTSIIIKHSGEDTRAKSGRKINVDRNRIESEILVRHGELAGDCVPKVYTYDPVMCCCVMEDLKDYDVMRKALLEHRAFPFFAEQISSYLADITLATTDVAMDHKQKKEQVKRYINPDLCSITEQLVYSDSVGNFSGKNYTVPALADFVQREIYGDEALRLEAAKLKFDFMNHAQALIHGDLHTGSIFINDRQIKVFDPEFACYAPIGYDVGNVIAHLLFALVNAQAVMPQGGEKDAFSGWCLGAVRDTIDLFAKKFLEKFDQLVTDDMAKTPGFREFYLAGVLSDTAGTAGIELIRRIVGVAKVADITGIADEAERARQEQRLLLIAKRFILNRAELASGADYLRVIGEQFPGLEAK